MADVLIALSPAVLASVLFFGFQVLANIVVSCAVCFAAELLYDLITMRDFSKKAVRRASVWDLSCFVTGVILALNLPVFLKVWGLNIKSGGAIVFSFDSLIACAAGSVFAIVLVKKLFGGIGRNFANPALTARIFLVMCFARGFLLSEVTWGSQFVAETGASWLGSRPAATGNWLLNLFLGNTATLAVGETSALAILLGFAYLVVRGRIDFRLPAAIVGFSFVFALIFGAIEGVHTGGALWSSALAHVLSGGLLFMAVFMATDYSTSPNTFIGSMVYAGIVALFTMLIRFYGSYPEGASFALLISNILVPLIDRFIVPKPFGYVKPPKKQKGVDKSC